MTDVPRPRRRQRKPGFTERWRVPSSSPSSPRYPPRRRKPPKKPAGTGRGRMAYQVADGGIHRLTDVVRGEKSRDATTYVVDTDETGRTCPYGCPKVRISGGRSRSLLLRVILISERAAMTGTISGRGVLEGAFALLEALNEHGGQAGLTQLVRTSGLPKTTVHRLLDQLADLGAVERADRRYRIGSRVFRLGRFWQPELRELAREWLPAQSVRMRTSLVLAVPREGRALVAAGAVLPADDVPVWPGMPLPPGTAAGRLLAAYHPALDEPDADAREILVAGYAVESETITPGLGCAAVPVRTPDGRVGAALATVLPAHRDPLSAVAGLASTARSFSAALATSSRTNQAG